MWGVPREIVVGSDVSTAFFFQRRYICDSVHSVHGIRLHGITEGRFSAVNLLLDIYSTIESSWLLLV